MSVFIVWDCWLFALSYKTEVHNRKRWFHLIQFFKRYSTVWTWISWVPIIVSRMVLPILLSCKTMSNFLGCSKCWYSYVCWSPFLTFQLGWEFNWNILFSETDFSALLRRRPGCRYNRWIYSHSIERILQTASRETPGVWTSQGVRLRHTQCTLKQTVAATGTYTRRLRSRLDFIPETTNDQTKREISVEQEN